MRTTKRFTPKVLARFDARGRSSGTYGEHSAWHQVTRGDPASSGRSHILNWRGRLRDLLSDGELGQQLFGTMLPDLDDCLEQLKLSTDSSPHPLAAYGERDATLLFPGTEELAKRLGIKHPKVHGDGETALWRMTTDFLLVLRPGGGPRVLRPVAFKPEGYDPTPRNLQLLRLECEYWKARGEDWLLITPKQYEQAVVLTLRRIAAWALDLPASAEARAAAVRVARDNAWRSQTSVLEHLAVELGSLEQAQVALWQAVWFGDLPIDLRRDWRPHRPLAIVTPQAFANFNPISAGRSAWI